MGQLELDGVVTRRVEVLRDVPYLRAWLPEMAHRIGMKPVGEVIVQEYAHWPGTAPSAVLFIEESAIVVHTYPEVDYIEITLHSCNPIRDHLTVGEEIVEQLGLQVKRARYAPERDWRERSHGATISLADALANR